MVSKGGRWRRERTPGREEGEEGTGSSVPGPSPHTPRPWSPSLIPHPREHLVLEKPPWEKAERSGAQAGALGRQARELTSQDPASWTSWEFMESELMRAHGQRSCRVAGRSPHRSPLSPCWECPLHVECAGNRLSPRPPSPSGARKRVMRPGAAKDTSASHRIHFGSPPSLSVQFSSVQSLSRI